jgi:hypothetical protein
LFFIIFFLIYGSVHLYAFLRARAALQFGTAHQIALLLVMAVMTLTPFFVRIAENNGYETFARWLSFGGYIWMGVLFLFFSWSLTLELYRLLVRVAEIFLHQHLGAFRPSLHLQFLIPLVLSIITAVYGYYEALNIRTEKITLQTSKLPESVDRLRIVQISDVHLGLIVREGRLRRILQVVSEAQPDILVSTGDLVDGQINGLPGLAEKLQTIKPRFGKFAISGNHEYYAGFQQAMDFTRRSGFTILRENTVSIPGLIAIAGVDDPAGRYFKKEDGISEKELLSGLSRKQFILLLKHRPFINKESLGLFDLQLSGHVHKGQIFPFGLLTRLYYPVHAGFSVLSRDSHLYVSRGSGTWGPPIRFLSPPEVTVIDLVRRHLG